MPKQHNSFISAVKARGCSLANSGSLPPPLEVALVIHLAASALPRGQTALSAYSLSPSTPFTKIPALLSALFLLGALCCSRKCYCTGDISMCSLTFPSGRSYSLYSPFYLLLLWLVGHHGGYFNIAVIKDL